MKISIAGQDYSAALDAAKPLEIERRLNEPSVCEFALSLPAGGTLAAPVRMGSVAITGDDGTVYFTGYIAATPLPEYAGVAMEGPRYRYMVHALSDEILLDQAGLAPSKGSSGLTAGGMIQALAAHTGGNALNASAVTLNAPMGKFVAEPGTVFSTTAGQVAAQSRAAYRAMNGVLWLSAIPSAEHALNEGDGSLTLANLYFAGGTGRWLANDITICGEREPAAYVTEYFLGDGVTTQFNLSAQPFFPPAAKATLIGELFDEAAIDERVWSVATGSTYFALGAGGLAMQGGSGIDGAAQVAWMDPVEMGGTLLLEAEGVTLANASTGIVAAFFAGISSASGCIAGFQATAQQGTGAVSLQPLILGAASGSTYQIDHEHQYTLRIRVHCAEVQRTLATYLSCGDGGAIANGGQMIAAGAKLQFEIQECVNGVLGMPVTLYDGTISTLPVACTVAAASSVNLHGTMRALRLTDLGPNWVVSTPANGGPFTRRIGTVAEAAECAVERAGKLLFNAGFAPGIGEQVAVSYRTTGRAVGRAVNAVSQQALAQAGLPQVASWMGSVTSPGARSSADCRNAAATLVQAAASAGALWSGTYKGTSLDFTSDVWPGDALALNAPSCGINSQLIVRAVKVSYRASTPDLIEYAIVFANEWAADLAIKTSATVPVDTWLPAAVAPGYPVNLNALAVTAVSGAAVTINTGATAPAGGGFEIRHRDHAFMPGEDPGLAMRGTQPTLTVARASANDRFYIRMYDGATPPNYSEFSAAVFINLPLGT